MRVYVWLSTRAADIYNAKDFYGVPISAHLDVYLETHKDFARVFYMESQWGLPSIPRILKCAKELDLSNQCDRIYAFMELPQFAGEQIKIRTDYSAPYLEVYKRFAIQYVRSTRSTEILNYVSHDAESLADGVSSWVPRWEIDRWSLSQSASDALLSRALSTPEPYIGEEGSLKVRGVIIDTVHYASDFLRWDTTTPETMKQVWDAINATQIQSPYIASSAIGNNEPYLLAAFLDALSANTYSGNVQQWEKAKNRFAVEARLRQNQNDNNYQNPRPEDYTNAYFNYIRSRTHDRCFILTSRGYMGLSPRPARAGDLCGIIFGTTNPCILRATGTEEDSKYLLVGATTLHGKECHEIEGGVSFWNILGDEDSKDWVEWDVEEQYIYLC